MRSVFQKRSCLLTTVSCLLLTSIAAFAQTDRGTFTGIVTDASSALIPGATVTATNTATGARYETVTTETGNYTLAQVPAGQYALMAELPGFRTFVRQGVRLQVAQTVRIDMAMQVGAVADEVTVTADAPLLQTESGELSTNVETERLNELPILGIGGAQAGSSSIRNPLAVTRLIPGAYLVPNSAIVIGGTASNSTTIRVEGQDATNGLVRFAQAQTQPSVDAVQEVTVQTSNFAAEHGQTGGGVFNYTMRSGTNRLHGSVYDYDVNEFLNAGTPFQPLATDGRNPREKSRKNNYGGTLGGPVVIPGVMDGHNRTFFFFNYEQFRENRLVNTQQFTVPHAALRNGDFSSALTGRRLGTDPLGRPIMEGTIYDPATQRVVNGQIVRDPFPGNIIPQNRWDPVAAKIQSFIPQPNRPGNVNNFTPEYRSERVTTIPSIKIDHNLSANHKLSFYASSTETGSQFSPELGGSDGLPPEITPARGTFIESHIERVNWDWTVSPRVLFHFGAGYQHNDFKDTSPAARKDPSSGTSNGQYAEKGFDALATFGLPGATRNLLIPQFGAMIGGGGSGGMKNMGPGAQSRTVLIKPTANFNLSWVTNNHTYKFGGDFRLEGYPVEGFTGSAGSYNFLPAQTGLGTLQNLGGGFVGHNYASFLLGLADNGNVSSVTNSRIGKQTWAFFGQDAWKVTSRFTLDYGLRWDYSTYFKEQYGRQPNFSPTVINTKTQTPGGVIFEGEGPGRCGCDFAENYPYAFGPRLGAAWRWSPRTVVRAGFGINYTSTADRDGGGIAATNPFSAPGAGLPATLLKNGPPLTPRPWPVFDAGIGPINLSQITNIIGVAIDPNAGRPARMFQWSLTVQREITPNFSVEVAYVGNRGVWWPANGLRNLNALSYERLASFGLDPRLAADRTLLRSQVQSATAVSRGFGPNSGRLPYPEFPRTQTVAQMLRPFPQFATIGSAYSPLGKTWYDALQVKTTKRLSHGLDFTTTFSWQKELSLGVNSNLNNILDYDSNKTLNSNSVPLSMLFAGNYRFPVLNTNPVLSWLIRDWQIGAVMRYASGLPILAPAAQGQLNNFLFLGNSFANRVPGEDPHTVDINGDFDPLKTFVLNPRAWVDPPLGEFGTGSAYYNDYRQRRRPDESISFGREFRMGEGKSLNIRAEFTNVFNRTPYPNPTSTNANQAQTTNALTGITTGGFGRISSALGVRDLPRNGTIVARFRF